jgi:subtilase family serine protease
LRSQTWFRRPVPPDTHRHSNKSVLRLGFRVQRVSFKAFFSLWKGFPMRRQLSFVCSLLVALACLFSPAVFSAQAESGQHLLITTNVDETKLTTLGGNTRPEAVRANDRGLVANDLLMEHMLLQLKRSPEQEQALQQFLEELTDSSSPNFHRWLTAKVFGDRYGVAKQDRDKIKSWLESHGLQVNVDYENGILIDFSGTAGQVGKAFHTEIHQLTVAGVQHFANMSNPQIPAALEPAVNGVVSLHDFRPRPEYNETNTGAFVVVPADLATMYNLNPLFSEGISGQGQTIALIEDSNVYTTADWDSFRTVFGLETYTEGSLTQIHPAPASGKNNCANPGVNGNDTEAILDAEYASAGAPSAAVVLASCKTKTTFGGLIALQNLLNESSAPPSLVSISYGECEAFNGASANAAYSAAYQQAASEGVSVFVAAGDGGAAACDAGSNFATHGIGVSGITSTPYNVSVGGTELSVGGLDDSPTNTNTYGSLLSYSSEEGWNYTCVSGWYQAWGAPADFKCDDAYWNSEFPFTIDTIAGGGGPSGCATGKPKKSGVVGGTCQGWAKPAWQALVGNPQDGVRDIPDVSLLAGGGWPWPYTSVGYPICFTGSGGVSCESAPEYWPSGNGTSFSTSIMAGFQALVNQKTGERQGNPNPVYYKLANTEYGSQGNSSCASVLGPASSCIFYDETIDSDYPVPQNNSVPCAGTVDCYYPNPGAVGELSTSDTSAQVSFQTTTGWDFPTGIGSVNAANLVNNWPTAKKK